MRRDGKYIIRGKPGSGKSTAIMLIRQALERRGVKVGGIRTPELREVGRRVGFGVEDLSTGKREIFASVNFTGGPRVSKYVVKVELFEEIAIPALERAMKECDIVLIDEIGKMELFSERFIEVVRGLWNSNVPAVGTAPVSKLPFVEEICSRSEVIWIERGKAEEIAGRLVREILSYLDIL